VTTDFNSGIRPLASFDAAIGNAELVACLVNLLRHRAGGGRKPRLFVAGPSGSGKSTLINHFARALACQQPVGGVEPCTRCFTCERFTSSMYTMEEVAIGGFYYCMINCRKLNQGQIQNYLEHVRWSVAVKLIHLEEASGLKRRETDETVMGYLDEINYADTYFVASAMDATQLDVQFLRRFTKVSTSPPGVEAFTELMARRCVALGIEVPDVTALFELARRSWRIVGQAESLLDGLALRGRPLTVKAMQGYPFPTKNPWVQPVFPA
jgi:hypothetical protein